MIKKIKIAIIVVLCAGEVALFIWLAFLSSADYDFGSENTSVDIILATLGIMITLFVGWQIYNAIEIHKAIEKSRREQRVIAAKIRHDLATKETEIRHDLATKETEIKNAILDLRKEFTTSLNEITHYSLLRYQDREIQMVVNAIFNIHTHSEYEILRDNSLGLLKDLLPDLIIVGENDNDKQKEDKKYNKWEICRVVEAEELASAKSVVSGSKILSDTDRDKLIEAISILSGHLDYIKEMLSRANSRDSSSK